MFDIGWSELLLVAVFAIVFVGPKDLPRLMRRLGQYTAKMRSMAREFQQSFEDMARESDLEDLRKEVESLRNQAMKPLNPATPQEPPLPVEDVDDAMADAIREAEAIEAQPLPPEAEPREPKS